MSFNNKYKLVKTNPGSTKPLASNSFKYFKKKATYATTQNTNGASNPINHSSMRQSSKPPSLAHTHTHHTSGIGTILESSNKLDQLLQQCRELGCTSGSKPSSSDSFKTNSTSSLLSVALAPKAVLASPAVFIENFNHTNPYKLTKIGKTKYAFVTL